MRRSVTCTGKASLDPRTYSAEPPLPPHLSSAHHRMPRVLLGILRELLWAASSAEAVHLAWYSRCPAALTGAIDRALVDFTHDVSGVSTALAACGALDCICGARDLPT